MNVANIAKSFDIDDLEELEKVVAEAKEIFSHLEDCKVGDQEARQAAAGARKILKTLEKLKYNWQTIEPQSQVLLEYYYDRFSHGKFGAVLRWSIGETVLYDPKNLVEAINNLHSFFQEFTENHTYKGSLPNYAEREVLYLLDKYWFYALGRESNSNQFLRFASCVVKTFGDDSRIAGTWAKIKKERKGELAPK